MPWFKLEPQDIEGTTYEAQVRTLPGEYTALESTGGWFSWLLGPAEADVQAHSYDNSYESGTHDRAVGFFDTWLGTAIAQEVSVSNEVGWTSTPSRILPYEYGLDFDAGMYDFGAFESYDTGYDGFGGVDGYGE